MDLDEALAPRSDQLDAVDLSGMPPRIFTVTDVEVRSGEQPVQVTLAEFPRVWRPSKGMGRVLRDCWGRDTKTWAGQRVELYTDPDVLFGKERVGGIRISRVSGIEKPRSVPMIVGRGKGGSWNVDPLPDAPTTQPSSRVDDLRAEWMSATPERQAEIQAEVARLTGAES